NLQVNGTSQFRVLSNGNLSVGPGGQGWITAAALNGFNNSGVGIGSGLFNNTIGGSAVNLAGSTFQGSSGSQYPVRVLPTYNQSGTAGSSDIVIERTETAIGSGTHNFIEGKVNSVTKFRVDRDGKIYGDGSTISNLPGSISGLTAGRIPFASAATALTDSSSLFWDNTNRRLGIGTTSPQGMLHLVNDGSGPLTPIFERASATLDTTYTALNVLATRNQASMADGFGSGMRFNIQSTNAVIYPMGAIVGQRDGADNTGAIGLLTWTAGTPNERMRISNVGDVGIGTTAPGAKLHVSSGHILLDNAQFLKGDANSGVDALLAGVDGSYFANYAPAGGLNGFRIGSSGFTSIEGDYNTFDLKFSTSSSERMRITTGGNVGVGTTSPGALLQLGTAGTSLGTMRLTGNTSGYVQVQPAAAAGSWTMTLPPNAGANGYFLKTNGAGVTTWDASGGLSGLTTGRVPFASSANSLADSSDFTFNTGSNQLSAWSYNASSGSGSYQIIGFPVLGRNSGNNALSIGNTDWVADTTFSSTSGELLRIKSDGKVGIGTTTPYFPLNLAASVGPKISLYDTGSSSSPFYGFSIDNSLLEIHTDGSASDIAFGYGRYGAFTETMRIRGNGNLGLGTASPASSLHIFSSTQNFNSGTTQLTLESSAATNPSAKLKFKTASANWDAYTVGGSLAIGNGDNTGNGSALTLSYSSPGDLKVAVNGGSGGVANLAVRGHAAIGSSVSFYQGTPPTSGLLVEGNVGIGNTAPSVKLDVTGTIVSRERLIATGRSVDLSLGNTHILSAPGGADITLTNAVNGGQYTLVINDTTSRIYTLDATSCPVAYYSPANGPTVNRSIFSVT
ncbi:MAG: hypothetical protein K2X47_20610, partial [Bdellovibrionales bacterium]|nr:hypothetical protein [Bdellovibrionales bacterium]